MTASSNNGTTAMDWQSGNGTLQDGIAHLLETGHKSDVEFMVGKELWDEKSRKWIPIEEPKLFKAHKLLLSIRSPVFDTQFNFNNGQQDNGMPIKVNDVTTSAFGAMLAFLYKEDLSLINSDNFLEVYSAAKKYLIQVLVEKCNELAPKMLNWKNSVDIWRVAKLHDDKVLIEHCLKFFDNDLQNVGAEDGDISFWSLNQKEYGELLNRDTLQIDWEADIFHCLYNWAFKQCKNAGIDKPTGQDLRNKIGPLINEICFPLIPHDHFIKHIVPTGILTAEEISAMLIHYCEGADPLPFFAKLRAITQRKGHNKLVDKDAVETEKAVLQTEKSLLRAEIERLKKKNGKSEEKIKQLEKKAKENEELLKKNVPKPQSQHPFASR